MPAATDNVEINFCVKALNRTDVLKIPFCVLLRCQDELHINTIREIKSYLTNKYMVVLNTY